MPGSPGRAHLTKPHQPRRSAAWLQDLSSELRAVGIMTVNHSLGRQSHRQEHCTSEGCMLTTRSLSHGQPAPVPTRRTGGMFVFWKSGSDGRTTTKTLQQTIPVLGSLRNLLRPSKVLSLSELCTLKLTRHHGPCPRAMTLLDTLASCLLRTDHRSSPEGE